MVKKAKKSCDNDYTCKYEWDEDCFCQCGDHGAVLDVKGAGSYFTAFFEAFPKVPDTFIRGEGKTVEDAEKDAWEQLQQIKNCKNHEYERKGYTNGAGFCKHCGLLKSHAFEPTTLCEICSKPTTYSYDIDNNYYCEKHADQIPLDKLNSWTLESRMKKLLINITNLDDFNKSKKYIEEFERREMIKPDYNDSYKKELVKEYFDKIKALDEYFNKEINFSAEYAIRKIIATASIIDLAKLFRVEKYKYKDSCFKVIDNDLIYYYIVMENENHENDLLMLTAQNLQNFCRHLTPESIFADVLTVLSKNLK